MKKTMSILFSFIFLSTLAAGLAIDTPLDEYTKGDEITFTIQCTQGRTNNFSIKEGTRIIVDQDFLCPALGQHSYSIFTNFLDPAGIWVAEISSSEGSAIKEITMNEKREAGFLLVRFQSPAQGTYFRGEIIPINVEIRDAGELVLDANAVFWGAKGEKIILQNKQNGTYFYEYTIPLDAEPKEFELEVLVQKKNQNSAIGGKGTVALEIQNSPVLIEILEPKATTFDMGENIRFSIKATYPNGKPLIDPSLNITLGDTKTSFSKISENVFEASPKATLVASGSIDATINASDTFGNSSEKKLSLVITCSPTCLVKQYGLYFAGLLLIVFVIGRTILSKAKTQNDLVSLEKEKQKTLELIKSLQAEYFGKGVMPAASYKKNLAEYKEKIVEIEERIKNLKETKK